MTRRGHINYFENLHDQQAGQPLDLYFCGSEDCAPNHKYGPTARVHYLMHYVTKGKGIYRVNGKKYTIHKDQAFIIFPNDITYYQADENDPWTYHWIGFDGLFVQEILKTCNISEETPHIIPLNKKKTREAFMEIVDHALEYSETLASKYKQISLLYSLFSSLVVAEKVNVKSEAYYIDRAVTFIKNNYMYPVSISALANSISIDRTHLFRLFKNTLNVSPQEYLIQYRLKIAKEMLLKTDRSITEIAYSAGFSSTGLFYKHFSKKVGTSPKAFRNS